MGLCICVHVCTCSCMCRYPCMVCIEHLWCFFFSFAICPDILDTGSPTAWNMQSRLAESICLCLPALGLQTSATALCFARCFLGLELRHSHLPWQALSQLICFSSPLMGALLERQAFSLFPGRHYMAVFFC